MRALGTPSQSRHIPFDLCIIQLSCPAQTLKAVENIINNFKCLCIEIIGFLWEHKTMRHGSHRDP